MPGLSIVIPVLNERQTFGSVLSGLAPLRARGAEIIVADGGSRDGTPDIARPLADRVIEATRGRAAQMNAGAAVARGEMLLFLHADTRLPQQADRLVNSALQSPHVWGRFDVRIEGRHPLLWLVARMMSWRSRFSGIATGDQAIFVTRAAFESVGGFPDIPLMEDVAISKRLKRLSSPLCLRACVTTSGRRWDEHGFWRTILMMWRLRLAYHFKAEPMPLARRYGYDAE